MSFSCLREADRFERILAPGKQLETSGIGIVEGDLSAVRPASMPDVDVEPDADPVTIYPSREHEHVMTRGQRPDAYEPPARRDSRLIPGHPRIDALNEVPVLQLDRVDAGESQGVIEAT